MAIFTVDSGGILQVGTTLQVGPAPSASPESGFPEWGRKSSLTIDSGQINNTLTDFPVLFTSANLPSEMFDADGANPASNGGGDIRFSSDEFGMTQIPCEVVSFVTDADPLNGSAQIWVKVPSISDTVNTTIYVWYDNAGESQPVVTDPFGRNAVWDANFVGVYHLEEDPSGTAPQMIDSSGNNRHGTTNNMDAGDSISGKIDQGLNFDTTNHVVLDNVDFGLEMTIEVWFRSPTNTTFRQMVSRDSGTNRIWQFRISNDGAVGLIWWRDSDSALSANFQTPQPWDDNIFHLGVARFGGAADSSIWVDGVSRATDPNNSDNLRDGLSTSPRIGAREALGSDNFDGGQDEVRLHTIRRSDAWLEASYANQSNPGTFATAGTPEDAN